MRKALESSKAPMQSFVHKSNKDDAAEQIAEAMKKSQKTGLYIPSRIKMNQRAGHNIHIRRPYIGYKSNPNNRNLG